MSGELVHPTLESVKAIHTEVLAAHGGSAGIRDEALLESALAAPLASMMGVPVMTDPIEISAAYLYYLCRNHPFIDGNKRTALATCLVFLKRNELLPSDELPVDDWESFVLDIAASRLGREQATWRLRGLLGGPSST